MAVKDDEATTLLPKTSLRNTRIAVASSLLYIVVLGILVSYTAPATKDMQQPGSRFRNITTDQISWIGSLFNLGCAFGNLFSGLISQKFGRKAILMLTSVFYLCSWLLIIYSPSMIFIYAGRLIGGICAGMYTVAVSAYIVEIAPTKIRGQMSTGFQIAFTVGVLYVMCLGIFLRWSWLAVAGAVVTALAALCMYFMPESPLWLIKAAQTEEAEDGLKFLKGRHVDPQKEMHALMDNIEHRGKIKFVEFSNPEIFKPTCIALTLMLCQQATGISPLLSYTVEIFEAVKSSIDPSVAAAVVALVQVVGTVLSGCLMDRSGRKRLFITSSSAMAMSLIILGTYSFIVKNRGISHYAWGYVPIVSFTVYIFSYSLGSGPIPYVMIPEMVPIKFRSIVVALAGVWCSLLGFTTNKTFHSMNVIFGNYGVYWMYGVLTIVSALFGFFVLPETKGMSIREITRSFSISK